MTPTLCIRAHYELAPGYDDEGNPVTVQHEDGGVTWWDIRPAPAAYGLLCRKCFGRLNYVLGQFPQLLSHIRSQVKPKMESARGERVGGTPELPLPLNTKALEDSHDLYAAVANWMTSHARAISSVPPVTLWESYQKDIDVRHLPVWVEQRATYGLAYDLYDWYQRRRDLISFTAGVAAFHDELVELIQPLMRRYPQADNTKPRKHLCEVCGEVQVEARWVGDGWRDVVVDCSHCGWRAPAELIDRYIEWSEW